MRVFLVFFAAVLSMSQAWSLWGPDYEQVHVGDLANAQPGSRIVGGAPADIKYYPYTVQVQLSNQLVCGGTLVSQRHVLSAAHCFLNGNVIIPAKDFTIRAGATQRGSGGSNYRLSVIVIHGQYNPMTLNADLALLVTSSVVKLGANVGLAQIPMQGQIVQYNTILEQVGWGRTQEQLPTLPTVLQAVQVQAVNWTVCAQRYQNVPPSLGGPIALTSNMMCAGRLDIGGADACQGDSGGPLLLRAVPYDFVVGVTSFGAGCGHPTFPGVNTRVSAFTNWIVNTMAQYNSSPKLGSTNAVLLLTSILASLFIMTKEA